MLDFSYCKMLVAYSCLNIAQNVSKISIGGVLFFCNSHYVCLSFFITNLQGFLVMLQLILLTQLSTNAHQLRCVEKGLRLDKNISKKVYGVKGRLFLQNTKTSHRNIQYSSYLLSKCLGNLFSVSPQRQRPKYKVFFCGYQL